MQAKLYKSGMYLKEPQTGSVIKIVEIKAAILEKRHDDGHGLTYIAGTETWITYGHVAGTVLFPTSTILVDAFAETFMFWQRHTYPLDAYVFTQAEHAEYERARKEAGQHE